MASPCFRHIKSHARRSEDRPISQIRWAKFLLRLITGGIRGARELRRKAAAQIALLQSKGLRMTHLDTHMHTHVFSGCAPPLVASRSRRGASAPSVIRLSRNGRSAQLASASLTRVASLTALRVLESRSRRILLREKFVTTDGTIAMAGTGTLDASTLRSLLLKMPSGTWELVTHPGYNDAVLGEDECSIERLAPMGGNRCSYPGVSRHSARVLCAFDEFSVSNT